MSGSAPPRPPRPLKIFFDGGARPNPGPIEVAVVARGEVVFFDDLGDGTNGEAEWLALLSALELARSLDLPAFDLLGDSRSVIDQAQGQLSCRTEAARGFRDRFSAASEGTSLRRLRWIPRQQNLAGIALDARRR